MPSHGGKPESPTVVATRLGLGFKRGKNAPTLTWDGLLDLSCRAYWERRNNSGRGAGEGPRPVTTTGAL